MPDRVPIDEARLRAAVADERYWTAGHPERGAWQRWVADGYQALYSNGRASGGVVHVRAYVRDGHAVAAHMRGAPFRDPHDAGSALYAEDRPDAGSPQSDSAFHGLVVMRRNLLDGSSVVPVMAPRHRDGVIGRRPDAILEGGAGGGGAHRPSAGQNHSQVPSPPVISRRSQELVDVIAPGGRPIGGQQGGARSSIRTLPGGEPAAEAILQRLINGRGAVDITPPRYSGRMYRLDDGTVIGFRPSSASASPAVDINIPGYATVRKLYF